MSSKLILSCGGRAAQLYGGLTDAGGELRAGHLFEWEAIIRSRAAGARVFDMWGRSTPGIAHFKQGFGGRVVEYGGTFDLVIHPAAHTLVREGRRLLVGLARRRRGLGPACGPRAAHGEPGSPAARTPADDASGSVAVGDPADDAPSSRAAGDPRDDARGVAPDGKAP